MSEAARRWPERRFSQAISEGDGISVIPLLHGDLASLALAAEEAGAEALAVTSVDEVALLRPSTELPLLVRNVAPDEQALLAAREAGADACVFSFEELAAEEGRLERIDLLARDVGIELAVDVRDAGELARALEELDPEILVLSEREPEKGELELDRTLDLLADVPAGKLVVSESRITSRAQVLELERAGVDAVMLEAAPDGDGFSAAVAELTGRAETL
jgi:indole-3-glycerol phosphate synthase